jgi:hypothetical protein
MATKPALTRRRAEGPELPEAISAANINDKFVVCVLVADGARGEVIDGRVAFQTETEDEFTAAIERLTHRRVVAFLSANQTTPGVACELFFLDAAPLTQIADSG